LATENFDQHLTSALSDTLMPLGAEFSGCRSAGARYRLVCSAGTLTRVREVDAVRT